MVRSMTGYGRGTCELNGETIAIELSAVNHRFLDCSFRLPYAWAAVEAPLREVLKRQVARGKLNIAVRREYGMSGKLAIQFDADTARQYVAAADQLAAMLGTMDKLTLNTLARLDGVFRTAEEEQNLDEVRAALETALNTALEQFNAARETEGNALAQDLAVRVAALRESLAAVTARAPEIQAEFETQLRERIQELAAEPGLKEERLAIEIALMADKRDINEEIVRLESHLTRVDELLGAPEPAGHELGFIAQEIQREINTMGSKLRDIQTTREVVRMKSELEKFREQIQNIE